jgi:uncharacterized membrane protein
MSEWARAEPEPSIVTPERLVFFSDAVLAIAITLLALDLPVPQAATTGAFWRELADSRDAYLGFLISFIVIWGHWSGHHRVFRHVRRLGGRLGVWNMLWLLTIVLTPFATRVIVGDGAFPARFTIYAAVQALASVFFLLLAREIDRAGLSGDEPPSSLFAGRYLHALIAAGAFLASIPVAFVTHWAYLCWVGIPLLIRAQGAIWRRRQKTPAAAGQRHR